MSGPAADNLAGDGPMDEQNRSVGWVAVMLALAVAYFGWAFLAADYFQVDPTGPRGETNFWGNSISQLANLPRVISHGFQNKFWMIAVVGGAEVGVLILWVVMRKLERELWAK